MLIDLTSCRRNAALSQQSRVFEGTVRNFRNSKGAEGTNNKGLSLITCGGVVQMVRTPYSHPEQQIVKEISTAVAARGDVEIAVNSLRMELAVGSIESQPTGIPQS